MAERTVTVASTSGLHARPAAVVAQTAADLPIEVTIQKGEGEPVQAASILMLMTLGAVCGDEVTVRAEGDGADQAVAELAALLERNLDEE